MLLLLLKHLRHGLEWGKLESFIKSTDPIIPESSWRSQWRRDTWQVCFTCHFILILFLWDFWHVLELTEVWVMSDFVFFMICNKLDRFLPTCYDKNTCKKESSHVWEKVETVFNTCGKIFLERKKLFTVIRQRIFSLTDQSKMRFSLKFLHTENSFATSLPLIILL